MNFDWLAWSNPVATWWGFLLLVSGANIGLWLLLHRHAGSLGRERAFQVQLIILLCAAYVFGCAFRSVLPRADVQRIVMFDTWLSSVMVGRSVATIAEVCFAIQWALVLRQLGRFTNSDTALNISRMVVPLIVIAECCSWYAVLTTSYLGNTVENSIWAVTFLLIAVALLRLLIEFRGIVQLAMGATLVGIGCYLAFLVTVDVPMYFARWQADLAGGKELLSIVSGLYDVSTRWAVTHDIAQWRDEIPWMSLYFSAAVWSSLSLAGFVLMKHHWHRYHVNWAASGTRVPVRVRSENRF